MKKILLNILSISMFVLVFSGISIGVDAASLDSRVEKAIEWAVNIANDNSHGYSQARRNGPDYDCSSLVSTAFKMGGFPVSGTLTTSTMSNPFIKAGFVRYKKGAVSIQRGDILLKPGSHVELYLGDNTCVGAHSNYDGKTGDSGGKEIAVRNVSKCSFCKNKGYTYILRYPYSPKYTFNYDANGGIITHNSTEFTMSGSESLQLFNPFCVREGHICIGWTIKRNTDNKWLINGKEWIAESEIKDDTQKTVYSNYSIFVIDDVLTEGIVGDGSYTFYAIWKEGAPDLGDLNVDFYVDMQDVFYLLHHINFPESYPANQHVDYDKSGSVDLQDVVYFLFHVNFPERYSLNCTSQIDLYNYIK